MKKIILILTLASGFLGACKDSKNAEVKTGEAKEVKTDSLTADAKYTIDATESNLNWDAFQIGGGHHSGTLTIASGEIMTKEGNITGGKFIIDMNSLTNTDLKEAEKKAKLEKHLKSADFFDVEKFKEGEFVITEVIKGNGDSSVLKGNLKLKDITKGIEFPAYVKMEDNKIVSSAAFSIDRKKWNLNYMSEKSFGDKMIKDNIDIHLKVVVKK